MNFQLSFSFEILLLMIAKKRKIYDSRGEKKSSYNSHSYGHHFNHHNHDYTSSAHRRGNRSGFTFRGLFEPTPFYKIFGINIQLQQRIFHLHWLFDLFESILNKMRLMCVLDILNSFVLNSQISLVVVLT